mmetsp:Transcript_1278/g.3266  ORF Transcript_1278/g.3266 Transcript_1278/m.3266 type:complete len:92 (+) Transcript_1278:402-677(+)
MEIAIFSSKQFQFAVLRYQLVRYFQKEYKSALIIPDIFSVSRSKSTDPSTREFRTCDLQKKEASQPTTPSTTSQKTNRGFGKVDNCIFAMM